MDSVIQGFQSQDSKLKQTTADNFLKRIKQKSWFLETKNDVRTKVMSSSISIINDANPKIAMMGFDCLQALVSDFGDYYTPLVNMSFDLLINKFSDPKIQIRQKATESMICLIGLMDVCSGFDRLTTQLNHKNVRVREQVLITISALYENAQNNPQIAPLRNMPQICVKIGATLADPQASVRQAAIEALVKLFRVYGYSMKTILTNSGVRENQINTIIDSATTESDAFLLEFNNTPTPTSVSSTRNPATASATTRSRVVLGENTGLSSDSTGGGFPSGLSGNRLNIPITGIENNIVDEVTSSVRDGGNLKKNLSFTSRLPTGPSAVPPSVPLASTSRLSIGGNNGNSKRSSSAIPQRTSHGGVNGNSNDRSNFQTLQPSSSFCFTTTDDCCLSPSRSKNAGQGLSDSMCSGSVYDPETFLSLLKDGLPCTPVKINGERHLAELMTKVHQGINNTEWQARISGLQLLQNMASGNLSDFECVVHVVKEKMQDIITLVLDLRSQVCKEACRTVAILVTSLGQQFAPLIDSIHAALMKVVQNKIQVMSSPADRCMRIVVSLCVENRFLVQICENCTAKRSIVRKLSLEYLALACALWRTDMLERQMTLLKSTLRSALSDADQSARKTARVVFLTLHNRTQLQGLMETFIDELEPTQQRHLQSEMQIPSVESADLLKLIKSPGYIQECCEKLSAGKSTLSNINGPSTTTSTDSKSSLSSIVNINTTPVSIPVPSGVTMTAAAFLSSTAGPAAMTMNNVNVSATSSVNKSALASTMSRVKTPSTTAPIIAPMSSETDDMDIFAAFGDGKAQLGTVGRRMSLAAGPSRVIKSSSQHSQQMTDDTDKLPMKSMTASASRRMSMSNFDTLPTTTSVTSLRDSRDRVDFDTKQPQSVVQSEVPSSHASLRSGPSRNLSATSLLASNTTSSSAGVGFQGLTFSNSNGNSEQQVLVPVQSTAPPTVRKPSPITSAPLPVAPVPNTLSISTEGALVQEFEAMLSNTTVSGSVSNRRASMGFGGSTRLGDGPKRIIRPAAPAVETPAVTVEEPIVLSNDNTKEEEEVEKVEKIVTVPSFSVSVTKKPEKPVPTAVESMPPPVLVSQKPANVVKVKEATVAPTPVRPLTATTREVISTPKDTQSVEDRASRPHTVSTTVRSTMKSTQNANTASSSMVTGTNSKPTHSRVNNTTGDNHLDLTSSVNPHSRSFHAANKDNTTEQPSVFIFAPEILRGMSEDSQWNTRVQAFEHINTRLTRAIVENSALNVVMIESFVELSSNCIGDPHHKVAAEALTVLQTCIASFSAQIKTKLGSLVMALFLRLADRRANVRDTANTILNLVRSQFDPLLIMTALSPKMTEIPDRMKTALLQFLGAVTPHCVPYFAVHQNTWAFLGRMAGILGCGGSKPSTTLTVAGRRLLELVYKTNPQIVIGQISTLPFQQQVLLKKLLENLVPEIDQLVLVASRQDWSRETKKEAAASKALLKAQHIVNATTVYNDSKEDVLEQSLESHSELQSINVETADNQQSEQVSTVEENIQKSQQSTTLHSLQIPTVVNVTSNSQSGSPSSLYSTNFSDNGSQQSFSPTDNSYEARKARLLSPLMPMQTNEVMKAKAYSPPVSSPIKLSTEDTYSARHFSPHSMSPTDFLMTKRASVTTTEHTVAQLPASPYTENSHYTESDSMENSTEMFHSPQPPPPPLSTYKSETDYNDRIESERVVANLFPVTVIEKLLTQAEVKVQTPVSESKQHKGGDSQSKASPLLTTMTTSAVHSAEKTPQSKEILKQTTPNQSTPQQVTVNTRHTPQSNEKTTVAVPLSATKITPAKQSVPNSSTLSHSALKATPSKSRDILWLLTAMRPDVPHDQKLEAAKELKVLSKTADDVYWQKNCAQIVSVLLESFSTPHNSPVKSAMSSPTQRANKTAVNGENMHLTAKMLHMLVRYRGNHVKIFLDLLATKLCQAAISSPPPVIQLFEQILSDLGAHDAERLIQVLTPYAAAAVTVSTTPTTETYPPHVRLMALHVICSVIHYVPTNILLDEMSTLIPTILPSVSAQVVDVRKAVIFVFVEMYLSVGDALFPYLSELTASQRKLLTIYIEKKMATSSRKVDEEETK